LDRKRLHASQRNTDDKSCEKQIRSVGKNGCDLYILNITEWQCLQGMGTWLRKPCLSPFKILCLFFFNDGTHVDCGRGALTSAVEQVKGEDGNIEDGNVVEDSREGGADFCDSSIEFRCSRGVGCIVLLAVESQFDTLDEDFLYE